MSRNWRAAWVRVKGMPGFCENWLIVGSSTRWSNTWLRPCDLGKVLVSLRNAGCVEEMAMEPMERRAGRS
ncbi:hypothetical protein HYQ46_010363 [Verticillium longisporum]|nr:hypothetical protein HYQ46_010363 [Verticillium longisporum]